MIYSIAYLLNDMINLVDIECKYNNSYYEVEITLSAFSLEVEQYNHEMYKLFK